MVIRLRTPARLTCPTASRDCHSLQSNRQNPKDKKRNKINIQLQILETNVDLRERMHHIGTRGIRWVGPYGDKDEDDTQHNEQRQHHKHQKRQPKVN